MSTNPRHLPIWMIWGSIFMSLVVFGGALVFLSQSWNEPPPELSIPLAAAFGVMALGQAGASIFWMQRFRKQFAQGGLAGTDIGRTYTTANIVSWALAESVAINGFILAFLGQDLRLYAILAVLAALTLVITRPKTEDMETFLPSGGPQG